MGEAGQAWLVCVYSAVVVGTALKGRRRGCLAVVAGAQFASYSVAVMVLRLVASPRRALLFLVVLFSRAFLTCESGGVRLRRWWGLGLLVVRAGCVCVWRGGAVALRVIEDVLFWVWLSGWSLVCAGSGAGAGFSVCRRWSRCP